MRRSVVLNLSDGSNSRFEILRRICRSTVSIDSKNDLKHLHITESTNIVPVSYFDGGSIDYTFLKFDLTLDGRFVSAQCINVPVQTSPFEDKVPPFVFSPGICCIRSGMSIGKKSKPTLLFCSEDYTNIVEKAIRCADPNHPDCLKDHAIAMDCIRIKSQNIISERLFSILETHTLLSSYRKKELESLNMKEDERVELIVKGFLTKSGSGFKITSEGRNLLSQRRK